ncbi:MAG: 2-C-methyl-D-erythritol 2,4-cyclodiphosphate synthase [Thomasclavelia sp.]|nr:2-C-methyl-D-erythritol 2,4-cyclodiphosphate synthase [Thomasclavelia sp.]
MVKIGQSIDIHQLVEDRDLIIGGVKIESDKGLLGHSDADVLLHAVIESIIGALGLGDIGQHFSDKDEKYKGISSMILLDECYKMMDSHGYKISNLDSTILCQSTMMAPYINQMKENIASGLHCKPEQINVKATRGEKLGFVGRDEGIEAHAVVLIEKKG